MLGSKKFFVCLMVPISVYASEPANDRAKAHIEVEQGPGILGLLNKYTDTGAALKTLAQVLLRGNQSHLSEGERELIASYVSSLNKCSFCCNSHGAAAAHLLDGNYELVQSVNNDYQTAQVSGRMKALLAIASKVQRSAGSVDAQDIEHARVQGASDRDIHDTVLIAAAFCMYNRYVDGLTAGAQQDMKVYDDIGKMLAQHGYVAHQK